MVQTKNSHSVEDEESDFYEEADIAIHLDDVN